MIKHVVMWEFAPTAKDQSAGENAKTFKDMLLSLKNKIACINTMEVGINENPSEANWTMGLIMTFDDMESLQVYRNHPEHKKIAAFCKEVRISRACVDFTI